MGPQFTIPKPCHKKWSDFRGEGRERFCDECRKPVYAIDYYSAEEWTNLRKTSAVNLCGLLSDPVQSPTRRMVLASALLTVISPLMAQNGRMRVKVTDASGAVVPGANGSLIDAEGRVTQTALADESGWLAFAGVAADYWKIAVSMPGFNSWKLLTNFVAGNGPEFEARLDLGIVGEVIQVGPSSEVVKSAPLSHGVIHIRARNPAGEVVPGSTASFFLASGELVRTAHAIGSEIMLTNLPLEAYRVRVTAPNLRDEEFRLTLPGDDDIHVEAMLSRPN